MDTVISQQLIFQGITLRGFWLTPALDGLGHEGIVSMYTRLVGMVAQGSLRAEVSARFRLTSISQALDRFETEARGGKVLLTENA